MSTTFVLANAEFDIHVKAVPEGQVITVYAEDFELTLLSRKPGAVSKGLLTAARLCARHAIAALAGVPDTSLPVGAESLPDWSYLQTAAIVGIGRSTYAH